MKRLLNLCVTKIPSTFRKSAAFCIPERTQTHVGDLQRTLGFGKNTHTYIKSFIKRKISFIQLHHILRKFLGFLPENYL